jgi:hypothetical protein
VLSILRGSPNTSCRRLTGLPTLSAAMRATGRTAYAPLHPSSSMLTPTAAKHAT